MITIGKTQIIAANIYYPRHGMWTIDARLDDDPGMPDGSPFTLSIDGAPVSNGVVTSTGEFSGRWRFLGGCTASRLSKPLKPTFLRNVSIAQALQQLGAQYGITINSNAAPMTLDNVTWSARCSGWQWLQRVFDGVSIRSNLQSVVTVAPLPVRNATAYTVQDYNAGLHRLQLSPPNLDVTMFAQPGDIITDGISGTQYTLDSTTIIIDNGRIRLDCVVA